jgi:hypothetical protein
MSLLALIALIPVVLTPRQVSDTLHYTVLMAGKPAGSQAVWTEAGVRHVRYEFNDRGRGPKIEERIELGPAVPGHRLCREVRLIRYESQC